VSRIIRTYGTAGISRDGTTPRISRSAATTATDSLPRFYPELEPSYQVALSSSAGRVIREDVGWSHRNTRGLETGGWLYSNPAQPDFIVVATVPGSDAAFSRSALRLGSEEALKAQALLPNLRQIGDWHLHPSGDDDSQPSPTDRRAWMRGWELTRSFWVGLIVTPAPTAWAQPRFHAWVTTGYDRDHLYCEPLRIREP
jgi:hypothetical protein